MTNLDVVMMEAIEDVAKQKEQKIMEQLNFFVSRGIIVIEEGPMAFVRDCNSLGYKINLMQEIKLVPKDKAYIEELEKENAEIKEILRKHREAVKLLESLYTELEDRI